jgi:hypothetical protein
MEEKLVQINQPVYDDESGQWVQVNDLDGHFDFAMTIGPSYTTQRQETAEAMMQMSNDPTPMGMLAKYGFLKSIDSPGMEEIRKGARKMLVQQGMLEPAEDEQPPQPPAPDPEKMAKAQLMGAQAQKVTVETAQIASEIGRPEQQPDNSIDAEKVKVAWFEAITKRMATGADVTEDERRFALDRVQAFHDMHMDRAAHQAGLVSQANDHAHQRQMAEFTARNQPSKES